MKFRIQCKPIDILWIFHKLLTMNVFTRRGLLCKSWLLNSDYKFEFNKVMFFVLVVVYHEEFT